jgi:hypothetical protein
MVCKTENASINSEINNDKREILTMIKEIVILDDNNDSMY